MTLTYAGEGLRDNSPGCERLQGSMPEMHGYVLHGLAITVAPTLLCSRWT